MSPGETEIVRRLEGLWAMADQHELRLTKAFATQVAGSNQK